MGTKALGWVESEITNPVCWIPWLQYAVFCVVKIRFSKLVVGGVTQTQSKTDILKQNTHFKVE